MIGRLRAWLGRRRVATARRAATRLPPPPSLCAENSPALGLNAGRMAGSAARAREACTSTLPAETVSQSRSSIPRRPQPSWPPPITRIAHEFDLLGSGPFVPVDPGRAAARGYRPIDWYLDPVQQPALSRAACRTREWNLARDASWPGRHQVSMGDGRCQHWLTLAQAFRITGDARYADRSVRSARRFHRSQSRRHRRELDLHDGRGDSAPSTGPWLADLIHAARVG